MIMRDQEERDPMFNGKGLEQFQDLVSVFRIQTARRFIRQKKSRSVDQGPGKGDPLAFTTTQGIG